MLPAYLHALHAILQRGDARDESAYTPLAELLSAYARSAGLANVHITILPKKTAAGHPDLRVWDGTARVIGYLEVKAPTADLDQAEASEQLQRYLAAFPNVILTNYYEFRLYRNATLISRVQLARPLPARLLKAPPAPEHAEEFFNLLAQFFSFSFPVIRDAAALAQHLARRTRFLDDAIAAELSSGAGPIPGFFHAFKEYLIHDLSPCDFADLYAQTVTYGFFAARLRARNGFSRKAAFDLIPHTIGVLRDLFRFISLGELSPHMEWIVDDIAAVLAATDVKAILHHYFVEHQGADPVVHFYETFLAAYDPAARERRGVYYTPEPIVSYTDRSLHELLQAVFNKPDGLADRSVILLDFAGGTQTYNATAARIAIEAFTATHGTGALNTFIQQHILENFYAFELMMAPYAIGHIKMAFLLEEFGYVLGPRDRFKFYLTNTLEMAELKESSLPGLSALSEESHMAARVKTETPVLVIHGNPPYSGISANMNAWIVNLLKDNLPGLQSYYEVDGAPLGEKKLWLQDDYVKFIRFAQWKIHQRGEGLIGIITNHNYLDNPTFRGMRQSLLRSFDDIYILDLHGNTKKKELCPDGSKDENVFDIQQGVCITLLVKRPRRVAEFARVHYAELWGAREKKYNWLRAHTHATTKWRVLKPNSPYYFFVPRDETGRKRYERYPALPDIFPVNVTGIVTARDSFVIDSDLAALRRRIELFRDASLSDELIRQTFHLKDTRGWKLPDARRALRDDPAWADKFVNILYRPFDVRWLYYAPTMVDWGRFDIMRHMLQPNLALMTCRQQNTKGFRHAFVTDRIAESCLVSNRTREIGYLFPLYLYQQPAKKSRASALASFTQALMLFEPPAPYHTDSATQPNISPRIWEACRRAYGASLTPETLFFYIYAILYSPAYRDTYAEFLKTDFPRVPFTKNTRLFKRLAALGEFLVNAHLLRQLPNKAPSVRFQGPGECRVTKPRYDDSTARLFINPTQYFAPVSPAVWNYHIGGYQVAAKWLKNRKDTVLDLQAIELYSQIITALAYTLDVQRDIDALYPSVESEVIEL